MVDVHLARDGCSADFFDFLFGRGLDATLCCGGDFATTSTARSKRAHASECSSVSSLEPDFFAMQPLSRIRPNTTMMSFGLDATMVLRPQIAVSIAECIAEWADIETM